MVLLRYLPKFDKHGFRKLNIHVSFSSRRLTSSSRILSESLLNIKTPISTSAPSSIQTEPQRYNPSTLTELTLPAAFEQVHKAFKLFPGLIPKQTILTDFLQACLNHHENVDPKEVIQILTTWYRNNLLVTPNEVSKAIELLIKKDAFFALETLSDLSTGLVPSASDIQLLLDRFLILQRENVLSGTVFGKPVSTTMAALATFALFDAFFLKPTQHACKRILTLIHESGKKDKDQVISLLLDEIKDSSPSIDFEPLYTYFSTPPTKI